jgi:pimeloyl-ACP methyl ester carboxylesterase
MSPVHAEVTYDNAETLSVDAARVEFAYRRSDNCDPALTDALAAEREVILVDESPTLVIQGDGDLMIPTKLSHLMAGLISEAQIRIYPGAAHDFLLQYPAQVAAEVNPFLARGSNG